MAQFRATIKGQRGEASRLGTKKSGISAHINGWELGVRVEACDVSGHDVFEVYITSGSNGGAQDQLIAILDENGVALYENGVILYPDKAR